MARAKYEYTKMVLEKVSFSSYLFCRELNKALHTLLPYEIQELSIWLQAYTANKPELLVCVNDFKKNRA